MADLRLCRSVLHSKCSIYSWTGSKRVPVSISGRRWNVWRRTTAVWCFRCRHSAARSRKRPRVRLLARVRWLGRNSASLAGPVLPLSFDANNTVVLRGDSVDGLDTSTRADLSKPALEPPEPNAFGSVRTKGHCLLSVGVESGFGRAHESASDAEQWLYGMEELSYATCEASFEAKSDEGRSGIGCRRPVSLTSGGRIRSGQRPGGGYADDEEHHARPRYYFRRRGNIRRQLGDVLRFREGENWSARVRHAAC